MRPRGFTLVELMIGVVIVAILMLVALPTFSEFMGNTRIRNTADSLANGIRQAQVEAIRRNRPIEFIVNPAVGWRINDPDPLVGGLVHAEPFSEASGQVVVNPQPPGAVRLVYDAIGQYRRVPDGGLAAPDPIVRIDITNTALASPHDLRVVADPALGTGVRVCDPSPSFTMAAHPEIACP
jgi:type IV fimbrial biogenesis protein FimT